MSVPRLHSSFTDADWLPVLEELLRGAQHSLNNRLAALDGVISLQEMGLSSREESLERLRSEMERLRQLVHLKRELTPKTTPRREPGRIGDALRAAVELFAHRADSRQVSFAKLEEEPVDVEPVMLWPADRFRAMVLLLIAASEAAVPGSVLRVIVLGGDHMVHVRVEGELAPSEAVESPAYQALVRFAAAEKGSCSCVPGGPEKNAAAMTLTLRGMNG